MQIVLVNATREVVVQQEQRLADAEQQVRLVRSVVEQGFSAVLIADAALPDPQIIYINPAFARATGYTSAEVVGKRLSQVASLSGVQQRFRSGWPAGASFHDEIATYQTSQGERWGEWRVGPVQDKQGTITHWLVIFRDITDRRLLEKEILEIGDQERRRLGQDLHDGLCQHLAGIELMSEVLEQKLARRSKADAARAGEIARHVRDAIAQTRLLARGLSPVTLESEGLESALQELAANTEKLFGVSCRVECSPVEPERDLGITTHLYRIAQEAVSNALRHGKATEVVIRYESNRKGSRLSITDNGRGIGEGEKGNGMGLRIMRYRAGIIGGRLSVESPATGGTRVVCVRGNELK